MRPNEAIYYNVLTTKVLCGLDPYSIQYIIEIYKFDKCEFIKAVNKKKGKAILAKAFWKDEHDGGFEFYSEIKLSDGLLNVDRLNTDLVFEDLFCYKIPNFTEYRDCTDFCYSSFWFKMIRLYKSKQMIRYIQKHKLSEQEKQFIEYKIKQLAPFRKISNYI